MAKELFITQWFSNEMRIAGENLIKRLDESGAQVVAAFWLLDSKEKTWKLTIVSPLVKTEGPKNYYKRINDIDESVNPAEEIISLHHIRVAKPNNRIVKALKNSILEDSMLANNRLGQNMLGGVYIEDIYLYRMDWKLLEDNAKNIINSNSSLYLKKTPAIAQ